LLRYFRRHASAEEASDLTQEAFARLAARQRDGASAVKRPAAYLQTIAGSLLKDRAKFAARHAAGLHVPAEDRDLAGPDPIRMLEARDMLDRMEAALRRLSPKAREIFLAHRLDGYTYTEIAERTGLSVKGVEMQMSRAIAHLDRVLSAR
jgi:RNA polymerase sigma-70 factor (ECF subfamily)